MAFIAHIGSIKGIILNSKIVCAERTVESDMLF
jgi:hypothetical protein